MNEPVLGIPLKEANSVMVFGLVPCLICEAAGQSGLKSPGPEPGLEPCEGAGGPEWTHPSAQGALEISRGWARRGWTFWVLLGAGL